MGRGRPRYLKCTCGHVWRARIKNPVICPVCHKVRSFESATKQEYTAYRQPTGNNPNEKLKCPHCGYEWNRRTEKPIRCPRCIRFLNPKETP